MVAVALLTCLLGAQSPVASAAPPNDLFLFFERTVDVAQYVNGSTVEAWAALNFSGTPDPPGQVDNIDFRWYAPGGGLAGSAVVDPDVNGWALSALRVTTVGTWTVNATYVGAPTLWANRTFAVVPEVWSGTVVLPRSTMVGGNATLRVDPGTIVRCDSGVYVRVKGNVTASGTPGSPILITSNSSTPAAGDWNSILFHAGSGNASVLDHVWIQYALEGLRLVAASPRVSNVSIADVVVGFTLTDVRARLREVGVSRASTGFYFEGGDITLENTTARDTSYGIVAIGGVLTVRNATVMNATQVGLSYQFATGLDLSDFSVTDSRIGILLTAARGRGERLLLSRLEDGIVASGTTDMWIGNSTFGSASSVHFRVRNSARVAGGNVTFPSAGERVFVDAGASSRLTLGNFLTVLVESFDTGNRLPDALVQVYLDDALATQTPTDSNGTTPSFFLPYRTYAPTRTETMVRILVSLSGHAFADNNRSGPLDTSRTSRFVGSVGDLDGDGEPDFSDPDVDGDDLDNVAEGVLGTDPRNPDSDGDGIPDGWEFDHQMDPRDASDATEDPDGDGLSNRFEYDLGSDPRTPDTDGDRMPDGWESDWNFDPTNPSDAQSDADADGFTNFEEFRGGTDPRNPREFPPSGSTGAWPFLVALVVALAMIALSLVIGRRRRAREPKPAKRAE